MFAEADMILIVFDGLRSSNPHNRNPYVIRCRMLKPASYPPHLLQLTPFELGMINIGML